MNKHSGVVNGDSGHDLKTFTIGRNPCSRQIGIGVHDPPELVFTVVRNTHLCNNSKPTGNQHQRTSGFVQPDYGRIHQELRRKGMTLMLLWQEHSSEHPGQSTHRYSQFCENYRRFAKSLKRSMRQVHVAGEKLFIDYAGPTVELIGGQRAHIFVAALGASSYTYACATPRETMADWLGATAQALTLVEGNLTSSSDLLKVDASTLTGDDTLAFDASAETTARVSVTGGNSNDLIIGSNANLTDTLSGGNGNDYLEGNAGVDIISGGAGRDIIAGGLGADVLSGGADGTDMLYYVGSAAAVNIQLTYGTTTVGHGGDAEGDTLNGFNQISGSAFDDSLTDTVANTIAFGYNANQFLGNAGNDRLTLGGGNDYGHGGVGNDTLYGGAGNDTLLGGDGTDYLYGGLGRDVQTGGIGADRFVFWTTTESLPTDRDVISDFIRSEGDKIDLRVIDADPTLALNQAFVWRGTGAFTGHHGDLRQVGSGTSWAVQGDVNGDKIADFSVTVVSPAGALIATDFLL